MKIQAKQLLEEVTFLRKVVKRDSTLPILDTICFDGKGMHGTNLETEVSFLCQHDIEGCVDAVALHRLLKSISGMGMIEVVSVNANDRLVVRWADGEASLKIHYKPEEFPRFKSEDEEFKPYAMNVGRRAIETALRFTGKDELRPVMSGVFIGHHIVATDAHRLYMTDDFHQLVTPVEDPKSNTGFIIPKSAAVCLSGAGVFDMDVTENLIARAFISDTCRVTWRCIDGRYPSYLAIIPTDHPLIVEVDTKEFKAAVEVALSMAHHYTHQGSFHFKVGHGVFISSEDDEKDMKSYLSMKMETVHSGNTASMVVGFNCVLLKHLLHSVKEKTLTISIKAPNTAVLFNEDFLLMPVMLND